MALESAHALDRAAQAYGEKGDWLRAVMTHQQAATAFSAAAASIPDPAASRTLHLLAQQSLRAAEEARYKATSAQTANPVKRVYKPTPTRVLPSVAGSMVDSRMTKRSESPGPSPASSIFPEGSYMVLRDDMNSSDPFQRFSTAIDGLLTQVSAPVAFATMPLSVPRPAASRKTSAVQPAKAEPKADPIGESFFIVSPAAPASSATPATRPDAPAFLPKARTASHPPPAGLGSTKTLEELTLENASLKASLDALSQRFQTLVQDQKRERESLKHSILTLGKDIRQQSDRVVRVPPAPVLGATAEEPGGPAATEVEGLKQELALAKLNAAKYKARYDQLREAIRKKRSAKEEEQSKAAAAAGEPAPSAAT